MTHAQRRNKKMDEIFDPELKRLKKCSFVSGQILKTLEERTDIDPCGLTECNLVDLIASVIRENYFRLQENNNV